jgi:predicted DNA-binding transcriptional regulator YafY
MTIELICNAIEARAVISFLYSGSVRTVEPHVLGYDRSEHLMLSAWQLSGGSGTGWRDFRFDRMSDVKLTEAKFSTARPGYNPNDTTMTRIICRL